MKLRSLGWNNRLEAQFNTLDHPQLEPGRVVRVDRGAVLVAGATTPRHASVAQHLDPNGESGPPVVGDWVAVDAALDLHVVRAILPRVGLLSRRKPGRSAEASQPIAANVDVVFLAEALDRGPNIRRVERGIALAFDSGATPVVILTKADLCSEIAHVVSQVEAAAPFAEVLATSLLSNAGIDAIAGLLRGGETAVLLGPSGVGKSTLANRLLGEDRLAASAVRAADHKGRHTTTRRELFVLPGGGSIIDTPGVRELGLWLEPEALGHAFSDVTELAAACRFTDCGHTCEPGCAVRNAVRKGDLDGDRLAGYLKLQREAEQLALRRDETRRREARAQDRALGRVYRTALQIKKRR